ncbi:MAG: hypothetical protein NZM43_11680, partial [Saprospiraceae bacterium]|nr:hypothetical protein [Saprospiraceae bacterium]MDW8484969.1 hypothetical protein [Saprospiraceae bacterium]
GRCQPKEITSSRPRNHPLQGRFPFFTRSIYLYVPLTRACDTFDFTIGYPAGRQRKIQPRFSFLEKRM